MSNRRVIVLVGAEILADICRPSRPGVWHRTDQGVPPDAKLVNAGYDWESHRFFCVFEHDSFPEVPEGERLPQFEGVQMSVFCLESPASEKTIAGLNKLTEKQIALQQVESQQQYDRNDWRVLPRFDPAKLAEAAGVQPHTVTGG